MKATLVFLSLAFWSMALIRLPAQIPDTSLNNLVFKPGNKTTAWGNLKWQKVGRGKQAIIFIPGWGFDGQSFRPYFEKYFADCRVYLINPPGYGGSDPYPMPPEGESYSKENWIKAVENGILQLIKSEKLRKPALVAHFYVASQLALELAADHPGLFSHVALIGSPAAMKFPPPRDTFSLPARIRLVDQILAPRWFKTVSEQTWRQGNFIPATYSLDSLIAMRRFEEANSAPLPVQIRYLCELWAADFQVLEKVKIPLLTLLPSFTQALLADEKNLYLKWHTEDWKPFLAKNPNLHAVTVQGSACNIMDDQPEVLSRLLHDFLFKKRR